jgi:uroporphyrinogen-III decarboxylase
MTSRERIARAMHLERPDRVPVMCQPSWGFVLLQNPGLDPIDLWHNHDGAYAKAFCTVTERFGFDGVMIPGVGLSPLDMGTVKRIDRRNSEGPVVTFKNGDRCIYCRNELPRYLHAGRPEADIETFDPEEIPERLAYHPPSNHLRMWLNESAPGRVAELRQSRALVGENVSLHGAIYSPEDYLIDLVGAPQAMMALLTHREKCREILERFARAVAIHAEEQCEAGIDAMDISAPWAGQGFISRTVYETLIAPAQKVLVRLCRARGVPCHCHTCGAIGDRLELIVDVGFDGIECLDPPPLGNVELEDAVRRIGDRAYIKGNIDPVNVLLRGSEAEITEAVRRCLETGMKAKGFILSTACTIAPDTPARNVALLRELAEKHGYY